MAKQGLIDLAFCAHLMGELGHPGQFRGAPEDRRSPVPLTVDVGRYSVRQLCSRVPLGALDRVGCAENFVGTAMPYTGVASAQGVGHRRSGPRTRGGEGATYEEEIDR